MIIRLAFSKEVVQTALKLSIIVGKLLGLINHGSDIIANTLTDAQIIQIAVNYLVPYSVSTYSSVSSILHYEKKTNR